VLWCSIEQRRLARLDQLTVAVDAGGGSRVLVAVADVDAGVPKNGALDAHASTNTTSVYTAAEVFPMLPERLSTDLTSLNAAEDRLAVIVDMTVGADGAVAGGEIYRARVRNHAKLAYNALAAWLEGQGPLPPAAARREGPRRESEAPGRARPGDEGAAPPPWLAGAAHAGGARRLRRRRARRPAARRGEPRQAADRGFHDRRQRRRGNLPRRARVASLRRVLRTPERWDRIVVLAASTAGGCRPRPTRRRWRRS